MQTEMEKHVQKYLTDQIPLSRFMQIRVEECNEKRTKLSAPLAPNKNDKGIGFGGSLAALAKLAAWAKFFEHHERTQLEGSLLIAKAETKFLAPARGDLIAICESPDQKAWEDFESSLEQKGKGRLLLTTHVFSNEVKVLQLEGHFASVRKFKSQ